ncbi:hypothetical protein [Spirochaeta thermophila]|uniref:hypothetical protein n=1 Tax=Winmispira thermophila TaxID=154 RepID=UPI001FE10629|nr:hypothetical protein [Spirochaeta thermophila]
MDIGELDFLQQGGGIPSEQGERTIGEHPLSHVYDETSLGVSQFHMFDFHERKDVGFDRAIGDLDIPSGFNVVQDLGDEKLETWCGTVPEGERNCPRQYKKGGHKNEEQKR